MNIEVARPMRKNELIDVMTRLLEEGLADEGVDDVSVQPSTPLIGGEAPIGSLSLASFIADLETCLAETTGNDELTLVSEEALSRSKSPFRTIESLADYVLELLGKAG